MKLLLVLTVLALTACHKNVAIYHHLSEGNGDAMKTCDANQSMRIEQKGSDAASAKSKAYATIRSTIKTKKGCGALIYNEGSGKQLDGTFNHVADFQFCRCK
ncbi:MAG: hypothetical protein ABI867_19985 [Kofleriaceae bacterium]